MTLLSQEAVAESATKKIGDLSQNESSANTDAKTKTETNGGDGEGPLAKFMTQVD